MFRHLNLQLGRDLTDGLLAALRSPGERLIAPDAAWQGLFGEPLRKAGRDWQPVFAAQTAYVAIAKLAAWQVLGGDGGIKFGYPVAEALATGQAFRPLGFPDLEQPDGFGWYAQPGTWSPALGAAFGAVAQAIVTGLAAMRQETPWDLALNPHGAEAAHPNARCVDHFRPLYEALLPVEVRHDLGEFYTPVWLAEAVVEEAFAAWSLEAAETLATSEAWDALDPCCGSGAFLLPLVSRVLAETRDMPPSARVAAVLGRVAGSDLNPLAVLAARVNVLVAIAPLLPPPEARTPLRLPIVRHDALAAEAPFGGRRFDLCVGNPPWVMWKDLPAAYREAVGPLVRTHALLPRGAYAGGNDLNIAAAIAHVALDRSVRSNGRLAFLMPRELLQARSAQVWRSAPLSDGTAKVWLHLSDWGALRPFAVGVQPVSYVFGRGGEAVAEVPMRVFRPSRLLVPRLSFFPELDWATLRPTLHASLLQAVSLGPPGSPYMIDEAVFLHEAKRLIGAGAYRGRRATETSPHAVFWLDPAEAMGRLALESQHLFPLLRARGVTAFRAKPDHALLLFPHDPAHTTQPLPPEELGPATRAYLAAHEARLAARGSQRQFRAGQPAYGLWRVGPYTFAPYKVVWREIGALQAAVISTAPMPWGEDKLLIPDGKLNLIACESSDEAHFLCAWLNAPVVRRMYANMSSQLSRPAILPFALPAYCHTLWTHRALGHLSLQAHAAARPVPERLLDWLVARSTRKPGLERGQPLVVSVAQHPSSVC